MKQLPRLTGFRSQAPTSIDRQMRLLIAPRNPGDILDGVRGTGKEKFFFLLLLSMSNQALRSQHNSPNFPPVETCKSSEIRTEETKWVPKRRSPGGLLVRHATGANRPDGLVAHTRRTVRRVRGGRLDESNDGER